MTPPIILGMLAAAVFAAFTFGFVAVWIHQSRRHDRPLELRDGPDTRGGA